ncbi:transposase [Thalassoglobus sp.]|uniref:transposase n=1 Tax=Thalassoglobus sp. TaxID=2795869 RepID=UPI003AA97B9B
MSAEKLLQRFIAKCPFAVLTQVAIRGLLRDELDQVFAANRSRQYVKEALFSDVALTVADVTLGLAQSFHQAYAEHKQRLGISLSSFYEKVRIELPISEAVVRVSAERAAQLQQELEFVEWDVLSGYRVYSVDGNHLQESEKRLGPLRDAYDAPLPGTTVARFDHQRQVFDRAYLLDDAHAQESTLQDRIVADLKPDDLLLGDRQYCVLRFLHGIDAAQAAFVIRQHGRFKGVLQGAPRQVGQTSRGTVSEQELRTSDRDDAQVMRRITITLNKLTKDGESEVHLLTNVPAEVNALTISELYLVRWEEETAFYYLTTTLTCELKSIGHPRAALFLFCMAMLAFNVRQILLATLYATHDESSVTEVSHFQISVEVRRYTDGMLAAIDPAHWPQLIPAELPALAQRLREIATAIPLSKYAKSHRGPKKRKPKPPQPKRKKTHMSTAKALEKAKLKTP